jgi:cytochrome c peroxidase
MTEQEKEGAILFFGKANCVKCHTGPALNAMEFYALGMNDLTTGTYGAINADENKAEHKGRGGFTGKDEDLFKFKVPQLYNLKGIEFLGHGAQFRTLKEVLEYKNKGIASNTKVPTSKLSPEFKALNLTTIEIQQIHAFLENALYDPNLQRYVPDFLPSLLCFPNNDLEAKKDKNCW